MYCGKQLSYLQVLGSFTMFNVQWPPTLNAVAQYMQGSASFDILHMPGLACLWADITFRSILYFYTLTPLSIIASLALPVGVAFARGLKSQEEVHHLNRRWSETLDKFWTNTSEFLFPYVYVEASACVCVVMLKTDVF